MGVTTWRLRFASIPRASGGGPVSVTLTLAGDGASQRLLEPRGPIHGQPSDGLTGAACGVALCRGLRKGGGPHRCILGAQHSLVQRNVRERVSQLLHTFGIFHSEMAELHHSTRALAPKAGGAALSSSPILPGCPPQTRAAPPCPPLTCIQAFRWGQGKESRESPGPVAQ